MQYYCYIGHRKKLKPNGWTFQKLYARNYHTYYKDGIIMYVVSKMCIELDNIKAKHQRKVIKFILENINKPDLFWQEKSAFFKDTLFPSWVIQNGEITSKHQSIINKRDWHLAWEIDNNIEYLEDGIPIRFAWVNAIKELIELGGVELKEIN